MKQLKLDDTMRYNGISTKDTFLRIWSKNFLNETSKFISATHLKNEDLGAIFQDHDGTEWKILGQMEGGREIPCEKLSTGQIFLWDRWKVSSLVHAEKHERSKRKIEWVVPAKEKKTRGGGAPKVEPQQLSLLDLFDEHEIKPEITILSAIYGAGDKTVDVTKKVKDLFGKKANLKVNNQMGGDPCPGQYKSLIMEYMLGEQKMTKTFPEKTLIQL
jgi:hypothetical protein